MPVVQINTNCGYLHLAFVHDQEIEYLNQPMKMWNEFLHIQ